mmetsp:Transcript_100442/g.319038  ORF Transcript_100442/g.319038 Transcript_100442/m.319038 type:complete len:216 (-) Transcript_100442:1052-1699(-)
MTALGHNASCSATRHRSGPCQTPPARPAPPQGWRPGPRRGGSPTAGPARRQRPRSSPTGGRPSRWLRRPGGRRRGRWRPTCPGGAASGRPRAAPLAAACLPPRPPTRARALESRGASSIAPASGPSELPLAAAPPIAPPACRPPDRRAAGASPRGPGSEARRGRAPPLPGARRRRRRCRGRRSGRPASARRRRPPLPPAPPTPPGRDDSGPPGRN